MSSRFSVPVQHRAARQVLLLAGAALLVLAQGAAGQTLLDPVTVSGTVPGEEAGTTGYVATRNATGTKSDTPLLETPQSVSVVTRAQMDAQAAQTLAEALRYTVGVQSEFRGRSTGVEVMTTRGFNLDRYWNGLVLPGIGAYGTPQVDQYLLGRIEVLKGPSSVLYGSGTPAGIVNMISKLPTAAPLHELRLATGSYGRIQGSFDVSGAADKEGKYLYRLTGDAYRAGTQVNYVDEARAAIAPAFTWRPTADTTLTLLASYQRDPDNYHDVAPSRGSVFPNVWGKVPTSFYAGEPGFQKFDRRTYAAGWLFEHRFGDDWVVRQNARYMNTDFALDAVMYAALGANDRTASRYSLRNRTDGDGIAVDSQVQKTIVAGGIAQTLLAGLDYQRVQASVRQGTGNAAPIDVFNPVYGAAIAAPTFATSTRQDQDQLGVYLQDQIRIGRFTGTLGARYDRVDISTRNRIANTTASQTDGSASWRIGAVYEFDYGIAPYAGYSTSFQPTLGTTYEGSTFRPRTGRQYEAGMRFQPQGFNALFTAAVFDIAQENVLTADTAHLCSVVPRPARCGNFSVQTGEVRSRGFELEARMAPLPGLDLTAAYSRLHAWVAKDANTALVTKTPAGIPSQMASAWADYTIQSGPLAGLGFGAGLRYIGSTPGDAENTFDAPSYTLADAAVHCHVGRAVPQLDSMKLQINASNLFDKEYVANCGTQAWCMYGLRRTVLAQVTYRW